MSGIFTSRDSVTAIASDGGRLVFAFVVVGKGKGLGSHHHSRGGGLINPPQMSALGRYIQRIPGRASPSPVRPGVAKRIGAWRQISVSSKGPQNSLNISLAKEGPYVVQGWRGYINSPSTD